MTNKIKGTQEIDQTTGTWPKDWHKTTQKLGFFSENSEKRIKQNNKRIFKFEREFSIFNLGLLAGIVLTLIGFLIYLHA